MRSGLGAFLKSSIGLKYIMGITGLGLCGFVFSHMMGNLSVFIGPEAYNKYGYAITGNKAFYMVAELGLLVLFGSHIIFGIRSAIKNKYARETGYKYGTNGDKSVENFASKSMIHQGMIILIFLVIHLTAFRFAEKPLVVYDGIEMANLFQMMVLKFSDPIYVTFYVFAVMVLGFHLSHGFSSAFQSLGLYHNKYTPKIKALGILFGILVAAGFISQPIYIYFFLNS